MKEKSTREDKSASYHFDVDVYWKSCAWVDTKFSVKWATNTLVQSVSHLNCFVLFFDNVPAQETDNFKNAVVGLNIVVWFRLKNVTDL